jgi:hypothetical protein
VVESWGMATFLLIGHAWRKSVMKKSVHPRHSLDLYVKAQTVCQCSSLVMEQEGSGGLMQLKEQPLLWVLLLEVSRNLCQEIIEEKNRWGKQILQAPFFLLHITTARVTWSMILILKMN